MASHDSLWRPSTAGHPREDEDEFSHWVASDCVDLNAAVIDHLSKHPGFTAGKPPHARTSGCDVGRLGALPLELAHMICLQMDIKTLLNFSQANLHARQLVWSLTQYNSVINHGSMALQALFRTRLASQITIRNLYTPSCTQDCVVCGRFGGFFYLPTMTRCCFKCLVDDPRFHVLMLSVARRKLNLPRTKKVNSSLMIVRSLPGKYTLSRQPRPVQNYLISMDDLIPVAKRFSRLYQTEESVRGRFDYKDFSYNVTRYMVTIALPSLDKSTGIAGHGWRCIGCTAAAKRKTYGWEEMMAAPLAPLYTQTSYRHHFGECKDAKIPVRRVEEAGLKRPDN